MIGDHRFSCLFATIRCGHFGCGEEMLRKDLEEHSKTCKFRKEKCPKCETIFADSDAKGESHDCVVSMKMRFEKMEFQMSEIVRSMKKKASQSTTSVVRVQNDLPGLRSFQFDA